MKRIIKKHISRKHYKAQAAIIWCFDDRFSGLFEDFLKYKKLKRKDLINIAGGIKDLASSDLFHEKNYVLGQLKKSLTLHNPDEIILMAHSECGAYGGKKFPNKQKERAFYEKEFKKAARAIRQCFWRRPDLKIEKYYADFDGLNKV